MIKWACLLHDIKKEGSPKIRGKDHIHPFKGATAVLQLAARLNIFHPSEESHKALEKILDLIDRSQQPLPRSWAKYFKPGESYCKTMHSHEHLPQIFAQLWENVSPKGSDLDLVLRFVMFH